MGSRNKFFSVNSEMIQNLDELVSEMTCDKPKVELLKQHMNNLGIEFCEDPNERMSRVLFLMQKIQIESAQAVPTTSVRNFEYKTDDLKMNDISRKKRARKDGIEI